MLDGGGEIRGRDMGWQAQERFESGGGSASVILLMTASVVPRWAGCISIGRGLFSVQ